MRGWILAGLAVLALTGTARAEDCSGQGSHDTLTFEEWVLVPGHAGLVELVYRLHEDKPVTRLQAHVYFEIVAGNVPADAPLLLADPHGLTPGGTATVQVSKQMAHRLIAAAPGSVSAYACTNVIEFSDGSGMIID